MRRALVAVLVAAVVAVSPAAGKLEQTPKRGGTVVFGPATEGTCLNPLTCAINNFIIEEVLPPALAAAPDSTWKPRLVSSVAFTKRPPLTLTYRIRPEARWSDGVPVTGRDFVFTHNAIRKQFADRAPYPHTRVRSIRALDAKTVRVVLRTRDAAWRGLFWLVLPRHALVGERPLKGLERRDRQPEDGLADRERPVPRRELGAWQAAHARPQPPLLGAAHFVSRPDRRPLPERRTGCGATG